MKLVIIGPAGKMGRLIVQEALKRPELYTIIGAVGNPKRDYIGKDISIAANCDLVGAPVYGRIQDIIAACDGVVDFSTVDTTMEVAAVCVQHQKPLLVGTTGFTPEQEALLSKAGEAIPISVAHNTSKVVNLMYTILRTITQAIGPEADIDILEMHDNQKLDAPSGTAKVIGQIIAEELGLSWEDAAQFGRAGMRSEGEITYHSIRSGNIASSHTVIFGLDGERLELTHHAYDYSTFAKGALEGIRFLEDQAPGVYDSDVILGIRK